MLKCKGCGADIPFVPETQNYVCPYCDTVHTQEDLTELEQDGEIRAHEHVWTEVKPDDLSGAQQMSFAQDTSDGMMDVYIYTCPQCGGELMTTEDTFATFCSYCGSSVLLNKREGKEEKPKHIIPFKISKDQAVQIYQERMKKAYFAPEYIRHMDVEKVRGIYMPYWTYTDKIQGTVQGRREDRIPMKGGTQVNTYDVDAYIDAEGDGIEFDAASSFPDDLSQAAGPFHFKMATDYKASYMSGFYADRGNMPESAYADEAHKTMMEIVSEYTSNRIHVPRTKMNMQIQNQIGAEKAMYPVWFVSARNHAQNKVSYAVINGETGKMAADIPVDPKKLLLGTLAMSVPLFLLMYLLLIPTPRVTAFVTGLLALAGLVIMLITTHGTEIKVGGSIGMNIAAGLISVILFLINPFRDEIYYIGLLIADALCVLSYVRIFAMSNKKQLRKLPQLGARGGDENA